ncbi:DUF1786 family protein [Methanolobus mangrovi]|uniref:DUF1786 family protein n=1 Tax=Methanolobus mangrovi TaxID=3072977 RepID=A0AA51YGL0_9EURY|nr:DUF1786 family protein [Methanolobus mangrovi]WMW22171.1 DUF1786 family protein [Methanolobus mangrovi]
MKILAIDVGTGTQDILLYDAEREVENSLVMVMPSPTVIIADRIKRATKEGLDILLKGDVMGGGPSVRAIKAHIEMGYKVYATENAALTIKDDLERVRSMGINIVEDGKDIPSGLEYITLKDIDLDAIEAALRSFGVGMPDKIAVAVQDHGNSPDISNRICRFQIFEKLIDEGGDFSKFAYEGNALPGEFTRMASVSRTTGKMDTIIMDTGPAAIFGALLDPRAIQPAIVVNIGNGHTLAAIVDNDRIVALFEHHTSALDGIKLQGYINEFACGKLGFDDIFNDGGHGCYIKESHGPDAIMSVMITGPRRNILQNLKPEDRDIAIWEKLHFAAPFGNMMLSGCYGLLMPQLKQYV